jgi:uncharacterized membrane protein
MSQLIVVTFETAEEAAQVHHTLHTGEKGGYIDLKDSAVIMCDAEGKIHIQNDISDGSKSGALWGGLLGAIFAGIFFPVGMILVGIGAGALIGRMGDQIDKKFVNEVKEKLKPNTSAILFIFRGEDASYAIAAMRPYKGEVLHTTLTEDQEKALRDELKKRIK